MSREKWDEQKRQIKDCKKREHRLSEWEQEFIGSLQQAVLDRKSLTEKQTTMLDTVWEKATANG